MGHVECCLEVPAPYVPVGEYKHGPFALMDALGEVVNQGTPRDPVPLLQTQPQTVVVTLLQVNAKLLQHPLGHRRVARVVHRKGVVDVLRGQAAVAFELGHAEVVDVPHVPEEEVAGYGEDEEAEDEGGEEDVEDDGEVVVLAGLEVH